MVCSGICDVRVQSTSARAGPETVALLDSGAADQVDGAPHTVVLQQFNDVASLTEVFVESKGFWKALVCVCVLCRSFCVAN